MFVEFPEAAPAEDATAPPLWRVSDLLLGLGALAASMVAVAAALVVFDVALNLTGEGRDVGAGVATIGFELLLGAAVLVLARRRGLGWADLGFVRPRRWGPAVIAWTGAYVVIVGYGLLLSALAALGVDVSTFDQGNALPVELGRSVLVVLVFGVGVAVVAPLCEELFFRALLFRGMRGYWRLAPSLAMSGAAFGLFHFNPSVMLPFALIGVLFAWANEQSGSLWTSIAAHAAVNGVSFALSLAVEV